MIRIKFVLRQARRGNFKPLRMYISCVAYGITHYSCKRCNLQKGLNTARFCVKCQNEFLFEALRDA